MVLLAVKRGDEFLGLVRVDTNMPPRGVLMGGSIAPAVFRSRESAQKAIRRTKDYASQMGYDWTPMRIVRLVEREEK